MKIPSFDELVANLGDEKKMADAKRKTLRIKKEAKLSSLVKQAQIANIEAVDRLNEALLSETADEALAVKSVLDTQKNLDFYTDIYSALFPNG